MSYSILFNLKVEYRKVDKINEVTKYLLEHLQEYQEMVFTLDILYNGVYDRWYGHNYEMIKLSKVFPKYLFTLYADGSIPDDIKQHYYLNGEMDFNKVRLPSELKEEYDKLEELADLEYEREEELEKRKFEELSELEKEKFKKLSESPILTDEELELFHNFYDINKDRLIFPEYDKKNLAPLSSYDGEVDIEFEKERSLEDQTRKLDQETIEEAKRLIEELSKKEI